MVKLLLDERALEVAEGTTIFQAAGQAGVSIPHFCYHPAFAPEGSCRMCLVEIEGLPKLELSCSTVVREGMKVMTRSDKVIEARRSVLEFLLAEHPLDCPICDKAGECKLQDYYGAHGLYQSVFAEFKEKREKKVPLGKTQVLDRERCVLCTRCVRFLERVTGTGELGIFERGNEAEVGIYDLTPVNNNYSGCLSEICPVGAITDTEFRFKTRAWFLERGDSICPHCGRGCNIVIEHVPGFPRVPGSRRVFRINTRPNADINGYWICDVGRYTYSFLDSGRQERLEVKDGRLGIEPSWDHVIGFLADRLAAHASGESRGRVGIMASARLTNEELFLLRRIFLQDLGVRKIFLIDAREGTADGLLLTADRVPNIRGATEVGLKFGLPDLKGLAGELDLLLLFGPDLFERFGPGETKPFLDTVGLKVLFTSRQGLENEAVDIVAPVAPAAEKAGSFTNIKGRVQSFTPVRGPCGEVLAEWEVLLRLAVVLKLDPGFYEGLKSIADVRAALARDVLFFGPRS
jgi:NADH-quinone oxidoreductase subunit G